MADFDFSWIEDLTKAIMAGVAAGILIFLVLVVSLFVFI